MTEKKYMIRVGNRLIEVTKDVYLDYYRSKRRERAQREKDIYNHCVFFSALDTNELSGEDMVPDLYSPSVEEQVMIKLLVEQLHTNLRLLPAEEQELIYALYFQGLTERELSRRWEIPHMTLHDRKVRALAHLKKLIEKENNPVQYPRESG